MMHITEKQLQLITEVASREAIKAHQEFAKQQQKEKQDRRLRNIKLLLRNYRSLKKHCEDIKLEIDGIDDKIHLVTIDADEFKLESIKRSKKKTLAMVSFVDKMLAVYKVMCEQSREQEDKRKYDVIYSMYISKDKLTAKEISELQSIAVRTVYTDIEKAFKDLSVLVFGLDGIGLQN